MLGKRRNLWGSVGLVLVFGLVVGCAQMGLEYAPKGPYLAYHKELPAAERAIEAARAAGKDRECPAEFKAAEQMKDEAYKTYWACRTQEAIAMANQAASQANALCPIRAAAPAPPPAAAPTVTLAASQFAIQQGQCTTLTWSSTDATSASIDQGIGSVPPNGSREVCPTSSTYYVVTATGPGGSETAATTIGVTPPPPPPAAPTASIAASPSAIQPGQCSTLTWSSTNATDVSIDQAIGGVPASGSRQVCPTSSTSYLLTAKGPGGAQTASTTIGVASPPAERMTLRINFDTDKATIRPADVPELQKAVEFVKRYPGRKVFIEGHTDNVGTAKYNQGLSARRAEAVKDYLLKAGVPGPERMTTMGLGQTKPVADNATPEGRFLNRRVEIVVLP